MNCESLAIIVAEALERADTHLRNAGPSHPILRTTQSPAGFLTRLKIHASIQVHIRLHCFCPVAIALDQGYPVVFSLV